MDKNDDDDDVENTLSRCAFLCSYDRMIVRSHLHFVCGLSTLVLVCGHEVLRRVRRVLVLVLRHLKKQQE